MKTENPNISFYPQDNAVFVSPSSYSWGHLRKVNSLASSNIKDPRLYAGLSNFKNHHLDNDTKLSFSVTKSEYGRNLGAENKGQKTHKSIVGSLGEIIINLDVLSYPVCLCIVRHVHVCMHVCIYVCIQGMMVTAVTISLLFKTSAKSLTSTSIVVVQNITPSFLGRILLLPIPHLPSNASL